MRLTGGLSLAGWKAALLVAAESGNKTGRPASRAGIGLQAGLGGNSRAGCRGYGWLNTAKHRAARVKKFLPALPGCHQQAKRASIPSRDESVCLQALNTEMSMTKAIAW